MTPINPPISRSEAAAIIDHAFAGDRQLLAIVPLGGGQVNSTGMVILDDSQRLILRIAPDAEAVNAAPGWLSPHGLRREAAVITSAGMELTALLPQTVAHGFDGEIISRDWVLQEVMPGVPLETLLPTLDDDSAATIWQETGAFMRALHDRGRPPFGPLTDGPRPDTWLGLVRSDLAGLKDDFARFDLPIDILDRLGQGVERHASLLESVPAALIHSDLNPAHIFVTDNEDDGSLCLGGVIDLEYGRVADPLSDHLLAAAIVEGPSAESAAAIRSGYGNPDLGAGIEVRIQLASALSAAWDATLRAFQGNDVEQTLDTMERHVVAMERF